MRVFDDIINKKKCFLFFDDNEFSKEDLISKLQHIMF